MNVERKLSMLPLPLILFFIVSFLVQIITSLQTNELAVEYQPLKEPQSENVYKLYSLGSQSFLAHMATLKLQLHDNQAGRHINYANVAYEALSHWLILLQQLNTESEYPALLASRVFSNTQDKKQLKMILETVVELFEVNPKKNWRWMAEGAVIAKYHMQDLDFALMMARKLSKQSAQINLPDWAKDLEFIMLEEMNMIDAAIYIVEQSLNDDGVMHNDERRFLTQRLSVLRQKSVENATQ